MGLAWGYEVEAVGIALLRARHVLRRILWVHLTVHEYHWDHRALYWAVERFSLGTGHGGADLFWHRKRTDVSILQIRSGA